MPEELRRRIDAAPLVTIQWQCHSITSLGGSLQSNPLEGFRTSWISDWHNSTIRQLEALSGLNRCLTASSLHAKALFAAVESPTGGPNHLPRGPFPAARSPSFPRIHPNLGFFRAATRSFSSPRMRETETCVLFCWFLPVFGAPWE